MSASSHQEFGSGDRCLHAWDIHGDVAVGFTLYVSPILGDT